MKDIYLVNYEVQGIKTLEENVALSFYKKGITRNPDTQKYNIKAIYGMNGSGKSAIVASVDILRNLLINPGYLNNPMVQKNLESLVNKKTGFLFMAADFIADMADGIRQYHIEMKINKDASGKHVIAFERLDTKKATSVMGNMENVYEVKEGNLTIGMDIHEDFREEILKRTANLLETSSFCEVFLEKIFLQKELIANNLASLFIRAMAGIYIFARKIHVYIDQSDDHRDYLLAESLFDSEMKQFHSLLRFSNQMDGELLLTIEVTKNKIKKDNYKLFSNDIDKLLEFIKIFKPELKKIEIDKKEDADYYVCNLLMVYPDYKIDAEFESTGVKKLIKLYTYLREMVNGGIVFIDELDSNLHDVYLCALLEYLMEYGQGQLCFTTHNVGPMDVLRQNKKSIDFLSLDHKIYPWIKNGNYSPSKLYKEGMIEGSPFNVDAIDFIGVFDAKEAD